MPRPKDRWLFGADAAVRADLPEGDTPRIEKLDQVRSRHLQMLDRLTPGVMQ